MCICGEENGLVFNMKNVVGALLVGHIRVCGIVRRNISDAISGVQCKAA